jgi:CheY-like chemotaxis protein
MIDAAPWPSTPPALARGRPGRVDVLVVDDDRDIRETLQELLEGEGYEVATAHNGDTGLARARELRPSMILLDLFMPVVDGAEFRRRQLGDKELADIPVVVVSAAVGVEGRITALNVAAHLEKPLDIEVLFETVARYCG